MTEQITRYYDPIEETLEKIYKENRLKNPSEIPILNTQHSFFLAPNGDYLWFGEDHLLMIQTLASIQPHLPNGSMKPIESKQIQSFFIDLKIVKLHYELKPNNRLDFIFQTPLTPAQLKTIYKTYKDTPDLWITYDVVDLDKPFSVSGEGYREMIADLRKKNYLPREKDSGQ